MKTLKVNQIEKNRLSEKEMNLIKGGERFTCRCGCYYADAVGSSIESNGRANGVSGKETVKIEGKDIWLVSGEI
ncbi:MAG: TIGR04149 family rSAM-modified RiPP [Alistipes sp.]